MITISATTTGDFVEFKNIIVRIELPNGDEYELQYEHRAEGLLVRKAYGDKGSSMTIHPSASNQIMVK